MSVIKCKMCGGNLILTPGSSIAECESCGTMQTVPDIADDKKARLYNRANQYRMDSEFDKAYAAYENIVNDAPEEAEAYWGMLLSEYGVEYVDDPRTQKKIPTCHRTLTKSITANDNYKCACRYADPESRIMYEEEGETLAALQKKVLNASAKEEPYDVFICYKESDEQGNRTPDSVMAQEIYDALTAKDIRVFFSRISLEDKLGQDYEPCIFAALNSAKVMLMVTTDSDYCNSVWVKNEWKRYLGFMGTDASKVLIPVYKDISPYTLPDEFSKFQAQDMGKLGAIQDLTRGVEKILGKDKKAAKAGMTDDEKEAFHKMEGGHRMTKFYIFSALIFVVALFATGISISNAVYDHSPIVDWVLITTPARTFDISVLEWERPFLLPLMMPWPLIGVIALLTHGFKHPLPKWIFTIEFYAISLASIIFELRGSILGPILWVYLGILAFFSLLCTLTAYWKDKGKLVVHILVITVVLILLGVFALI